MHVAPSRSQTSAADLPWPSTVRAWRRWTPGPSPAQPDSYPTAVDATAVANWQLLAASNAFTKGEVMLANYRAWFQSSR